MPLVASFCHCPTLLRLQRLDIIPYKEIKDTRAQLKIQAAILHQDFSLMRVSSFVQTAIVAILAKSAEKGAGKNAQMGATMAARLGDPFAVQRILGHVDLTMAARYVQDVSEQTDRVIENSREFIIRGKS